jgi:hypothetical protein
VEAFSEIAVGNLNPNSFHCDADDPIAPWFYIRGLTQGAHFLLCCALGALWSDIFEVFSTRRCFSNAPPCAAMVFDCLLSGISDAFGRTAI